MQKGDELQAAQGEIGSLKAKLQENYFDIEYFNAKPQAAEARAEGLNENLQVAEREGRTIGGRT